MSACSVSSPKPDPSRLRFVAVSAIFMVFETVSPEAHADNIINYTFSPVSLYYYTSAQVGGPTGATVSGTLSFNWTNRSVVSANMTVTPSSATSPFAMGGDTFNAASVRAVVSSTYNGPSYTFNNVVYNTGTTFAEIWALTSSQSLYFDFTQLSTTDLFPGKLGNSFTSYENNTSAFNVNYNQMAVLGTTVQVSAPPSSTPINTTGASMQSSNLGTTLDPDFQGGTLSIVNGATTLSQNFTVSNVAGNSIDAGGNNAVFSGVLSGAGGITFSNSVSNNSVITLTGANTYSGVTAINSGATLSVGAGGTTGSIGPGQVVNQGTLVLNHNSPAIAPYTFANAVTGGGALTITGGGTSVISSPTGALGAITVTGGSTAYLNTGALNNSSHAEIVALNASLAPLQLFSGSSLTVDAGSTLRGAGYVSAPTTIAGTLRPGNSPGTIVFGASVTQAAGSVLALDIDGQGTGAGAGNYSSVIVNGTGHTYTASGAVSPILRGITGSANNTYSPEVGSIFTVVSATGGVLGSFTGITQPVSGLLTGTQFDSIYSANTFQLVITPTNLSGVSGLTPNEKAVGGALQAVRPTPGVRKTDAQAAVYDALYKLPVGAYALAYDRMSFAIYGDALMAQTDAAGLMGSTVSDQMAQRRGASLGGKGNAQKYCLDGGKAAKNPRDCRELTVWGAAIGQFARTFQTLGDPGYNSDNRGLMLGADVELDTVARVGAFAGYAAGSVDSPRTATKADLSTYSAGVYGSLDRPNMYVNALAGYVSGDQKVTRNPLGVAASGKPNASGALFSFELGSRYTVNDIVFEPNVGLKATSIHRGAMNETGASPLAATLSGDSVNTALASLGVRSIWRARLANSASMTVIGRAAYGRELGDQGTNVSGVFNALNTGLTVASSLRGRDAFLGGVTLAVTPSQGVDLFARYDAEVRNNANSQSISGGVKVAW